jgi:hypothetical protein
MVMLDLTEEEEAVLVELKVLAVVGRHLLPCLIQVLMEAEVGEVL